jgi:hypothetical protein
MPYAVLDDEVLNTVAAVRDGPYAQVVSAALNDTE